MPIDIPKEKDISWSAPKVTVPGTPKAKSGDVATLIFADDGDTAKFKRANGSLVNCRIEGLDAPETDKTKFGKRGAQPYAAESLDTLKTLLAKGEVRVTVTQAPSEKNFGRSLCKIEVEGKNLTTDMLRAGAAMLWEHGKDANRNPIDIAAANEAKTNKAGIYGLNVPPIDPFNWRH